MRSSAAACISGSSTRRSTRNSPSSASGCRTHRQRLASQVTTVVQELRQAGALQGAGRVGDARLGRGAGRRSIATRSTLESARRHASACCLKAKEDIEAIRGGVLAELIARRLTCRPSSHNLLVFGRLLRRARPGGRHRPTDRPRRGASIHRSRFARRRASRLPRRCSSSGRKTSPTFDSVFDRLLDAASSARRTTRAVERGTAETGACRAMPTSAGSGRGGARHRTQSGLRTWSDIETDRRQGFRAS